MKMKTVKLKKYKSLTGLSIQAFIFCITYMGDECPGHPESTDLLIESTDCMIM